MYTAIALQPENEKIKSIHKREHYEKKTIIMEWQTNLNMPFEIAHVFHTARECTRDMHVIKSNMTVQRSAHERM